MSDAQENNRDPGLPPVAPPSGRFIAQLFLVPGLIVLVAVLLLLGANMLFMGGYSPSYFLRGLDSPNADIRWRHANDLAQFLKRSETLKADVKFALDLAERLESAQDALADDEKRIAKEIEAGKDAASAWDKLTPQRNYVMYLSGLFGEFYAPVGLPVLARSLERETSPDLRGHVFMRRQILLILGSMGENVKKIEAIPAPLREKVLSELENEMASSNTRRSLWARNALLYLRPSVVSDTTGLVKADEVLARCARVDDQYQREQVALVLSLWNGDLVEPTLWELARDSGKGEVIQITND